MKTLAVALLLGLAQAETPEETNFIEMMNIEEKEILTLPTDEDLEKEDDMWEMEEEVELMNENLTPAQRKRYELQKKEFNEAAEAMSKWLKHAKKYGKRVHKMKQRNFKHLQYRMKIWCKKRAIVKRDFDILAQQVRQNFHIADLENNHKEAYLSNQHQISESLNRLKRADRRLHHTIKRDVKHFIHVNKKIDQWAKHRWTHKLGPALDKVADEWDDFGKSISNEEDQDIEAAVTQLNSAVNGETAAPVQRISLTRCIVYSILGTFSTAGIIAALFYKPGKAQEKKQIIIEDSENAPVEKKEIKKTLKSIMKQNNVKVNLM